MVASSSVTNSGPSLDWADDTDEEIDFGAPVFSDDDEITPIPARGVNTPDDPVDKSRSGNSAPPASRYTAGFADGSNHSLDRRTQNQSTVQPMSSRMRSNRSQPPYRDAPISSRQDRSSSSQFQSSGTSSSRSFERESHWRSDARRDQGIGGSSSSYSSSHDPAHHESDAHWGRRHEDRGPGPRSTRQVIPLPPKPTASLDANNNHPRFDRSRSPSYRERSPQPGGDRPWEHSRQPATSPNSYSNRSLSPSSLSSSSHLGLSTKSFNHSRQPRTYMDQVANANDRSRRRSKDLSSEGRWEKTPHEDKPYPTLHPAATSGSPKDDTVYFRRRDSRPNEQSHQDKVSSTMYHERLEPTKHRGTSGITTSNDRWEKAAVVEPDLPYPERAHQQPSSGSKGHGRDSRPKSRGHVEPAPAAILPVVEKTPSPRGNRGKGKDQHKRKSKDQSVLVGDEENEQEKESTSEVPWWEQSTYGAKSKKDEAMTDSGKASASKNKTGLSTTKQSAKQATTVSAKSRDTQKTSTEATEEVPWWEQSTYKVKPKVSSGESVAPQAGATTPAKVSTSTDSKAHREALGQKSLIAGVENLALVSRGGDDSRSSHSLKSRSVQERVYSEIKAMISKYEQQHGEDKLVQVPARTRQSEELDTILASFRKLREGLYATETRDTFAIQGK
ncbi:hypothetical protein BGX28_002696 [Mortierella sp. GBA30]|nr:hypothetical protein BGX28_002696 [Mortierella sp. GBA30]